MYHRLHKNLIIAFCNEIVCVCMCIRTISMQRCYNQSAKTSNLCNQSTSKKLIIRDQLTTSGWIIAGVKRINRLAVNSNKNNERIRIIYVLGNQKTARRLLEDPTGNDLGGGGVLEAVLGNTNNLNYIYNYFVRHSRTPFGQNILKINLHSFAHERGEGGG